MRESTERLERTLVGKTKLAGPNRELIVNETLRRLGKTTLREEASVGGETISYGDGRARPRIVTRLKRELQVF